MSYSTKRKVAVYVDASVSDFCKVFICPYIKYHCVSFCDLFIKTQRLPVLQNRYTILSFLSFFFSFYIWRNLVKHVENLLQVFSTSQDYKKSQLSLVSNNLIITRGNKYQDRDILGYREAPSFFPLVLLTHADNRRDRKEGCAL